MKSKNYYSVPSNNTKKTINAPKVSKSNLTVEESRKRRVQRQESDKQKRKKIAQEQRRLQNKARNKIYRYAFNNARSPYGRKVKSRSLSQEFGIPVKKILKVADLFSHLLAGRELSAGPPTKRVSKVLKFIEKNCTQNEIENTLNSMSGYLIKKNTLQEHLPILNKIAEEHDIEIKPIIPEKKVRTLKSLN